MVGIGYPLGKYGAGNTIDFLTLVGLGEVPEWSFVEKFGENPNIDTATAPEDIWSQGGVYTFSETADIDTLSSSDDGDNQTVTVLGLDADYNRQTQAITLDGQSKVTLPIPLWRVNRIINSDSTDIAGIVYCYVDGDITDGVPDDATDIRASVIDGNNQTEQAIYTIPGSCCGYFLGGYVSSSKTGINSNIVFTWRLREPGGVFRVQSRIAALAAGKSSWDYRYPIPVGPIPAGSDIKLTAEVVSANSTGAAGGFTILIKENV